MLLHHTGAGLVYCIPLFYLGIYVIQTKRLSAVSDFWIWYGRQPFYTHRSVSAEKFNNFVDGQGHMIGVLERMIGPFDGNEFNDVVFREPSGNLDGDHFVLCSVDDNHVIGIVEIFLLQYIEIPERVEKMLVDFHLPIEPYLDFLSLAELALVGFGSDTY